ncbi:hypothetical protein BGY98DRAFT_384865 [Russula aff. rugulosa BPL654]|nr:hypothetical protein BGY98DRAFT_384865 [Russula aff. rugulosa BPL654]
METFITSNGFNPDAFVQMAFQESRPLILGYSIRYDPPHLSLINTVPPSVGPLEDQDGPVCLTCSSQGSWVALGQVLALVPFSPVHGSEASILVASTIECRCAATAIANASATRNADRAPLASSGFSSRTFGDFKAGADCPRGCCATAGQEGKHEKRGVEDLNTVEDSI